MTARTAVVDGSGESARPYSHLLPVLEAEIRWGNRVLDDGFRALPDGWFAATLMRPLHVDRLRDVFEFPAHIRVGRHDDGTTFVIDGENRVRLVAPGAEGAPARRPSLLARILNR